MPSTVSTKRIQQKNRIETVLSVFLISLGCLLCSFIPDQTTDTVAKIGICFLCGMIFILSYLILMNQLTWKRAIVLLLITGFVLRILYILYTGYRTRQHDVWSVEDRKGHMGYLQYIAANLSLPDTNETWQFYHPPLHHILAGLLYRFLEKAGMQPTLIAEKLQFLTMFYSCLAMLVCDRLFATLGLSDKSRFVADTVIVFQPSFLLIGGGLNNDMLFLLLALLSLLYFVKWWKTEKTHYLFFCALFLGLSMCAKLLGAILAFPYAFCFLWKLIEKIKQHKVSHLLTQYVLFGAVSIPLGMWYPIRNLIRFNQSILYVPDLGTGSSQYLGDVPILQRLFSIPFSQISYPYQCWGKADEPGKGFNVLLSLFKTSVFGEFKLGAGFWAYFLLFSFIAISLTAIGVLLWKCTDHYENSMNVLNGMWAILWISIFASYMLFVFRMPHICSQDFRYLSITLPVLAIFFAKAVDLSKKSWVKNLFLWVLLLFSLSSFMTYAIPSVWGL